MPVNVVFLKNWIFETPVTRVEKMRSVEITKQASSQQVNISIVLSSMSECVYFINVVNVFCWIYRDVCKNW